MTPGHITRRELLKGTLTGAAGLALYGSPLLATAAEPARSKTPKSVVAIARSARALNDSLQVDKAAAADIVNQAVSAVVGTQPTEQPWKKLFQPTDTVGIVTSKSVNPTHMELADIVRDELQATGVPEANICFPQGDIAMVNKCTALIALPALKAHWLTGIGTVLKLYILYSGKASFYHNENSAKLGEIWNTNSLRSKTRIVIVDALRPLCDKGPQPDPRYMWNYNGIIASIDPVAAEAVGLKIIQAKRDEIKGEPWPISPPPLCVEAAQKEHLLGTCDLAKIDIKRLGWAEGVLV